MDRECLELGLEQQLDELDLLQSVFSQPGEYTTDQAAVAHANSWLRRLTEDAPVGRLSCKLHLSVDATNTDEDGEGDASRDHTAVQCNVDISMTLPHRYPNEHPKVYVSSNYLSRRGQDDLNSDLTAFVASLPPGEVCLLSIVEWVKEHTGSYCPITTPPSELPEVDSSAAAASSHATFCRMWLYMHHIYSKTKRRNILDLADELELSGFCLPGKPGVVCVEGDEANTKHFYNVLRRWNWKSISCRHREVVTECSDVSSQRRIEGFGELALVTHGPRQNHMDMGQFRAYLEEHRLGYMFTQLFGVEGHVT